MHAMNDPDVYVRLEELKLVLCACPKIINVPKNSFPTANKSCVALPNFLYTIFFRFVNVHILRSAQITSCHKVCS